ncbi:MAG: formylglycine-generating enzyme family protein [Myxococcales bacterium]|nr:formylglycine-generating enzyme family protein [Myxococcales bacterium]
MQTRIEETDGYDKGRSWAARLAARVDQQNQRTGFLWGLAAAVAAAAAVWLAAVSVFGIHVGAGGVLALAAAVAGSGAILVWSGAKRVMVVPPPPRTDVPETRGETADGAAEGTGAEVVGAGQETAPAPPEDPVEQDGGESGVASIEDTPLALVIQAQRAVESRAQRRDGRPAEDPAPFPTKAFQVHAAAFEQILLPGGVFQMGSADDDGTAYADEKPQHPVELSPFWIMTTPVTQGLWAEVMRERRGWPENQDSNPVNNVDWVDAARFCNALSLRVGLDPVYDIDDNGKVDWQRGKSGFSLPTEAQWEYACRAGTTTPWFFGPNPDPTLLSQYAWWKKNSKDQTQPVATRNPNPWGLYDMLGNVDEWCWDWFGSYVRSSEAPVVDPAGGQDGTARVVRGGAFVYVDPNLLRSANRYGDDPSNRLWMLGFRCVRDFLVP